MKIESGSIRILWCADLIPSHMQWVWPHKTRWRVRKSSPQLFCWRKHSRTILLSLLSLRNRPRSRFRVATWTRDKSYQKRTAACKAWKQTVRMKKRKKCSRQKPFRIFMILNDVHHTKFRINHQCDFWRRASRCDRKPRSSERVNQLHHFQHQ